VIFTVLRLGQPRAGAWATRHCHGGYEYMNVLLIAGRWQANGLLGL